MTLKLESWMATYRFNMKEEALGFHSFSRNAPRSFLYIDLCPCRGGGFCKAVQE